MRGNKSINSFLQSYEIGPLEDKIIDDCIHEMEAVISNGTVKNIPSIRYFVEIRLRLMKDEILLSLCLSIGLFTLLHFLERTLNLILHMDTVIGIAPFLVVPIFMSIVRSKRTRMFEFEAVSWLGMNRTLAIKLSINQMLAIALLLITWIMAGIAGDEFILNRFFFSMTIFEVVLISMLQLGRSSINGAGFLVAAFIVAAVALSRSTALLLWIYHVDSILLCFIICVTVICAQLIVKRYSSKITFENEVLKWNLG